ncbi:ABC transporter ATP-binding protein [Metabacillus iocasae]|uniref:ABC-2 type transport system ATP-binding protein n=1 Tax=Priestia iocasae TaxID=2291674 RepID=A0ABS2QT05_9BACI|nr:ABC transporter ATP-binding protein [Metabacillus iocasae]MBM7702157.1 ABC-2 type transport system ATP-binding protein [Metabacillus iocasae]
MNHLIIETNHLTKEFKGMKVVNEVNLLIKKGEIYGFLGPNGAGKTTTIRMLLGLTKPTSGSMKLFNQPAETHHLQARRKIGSLVESPSYYGHLTGRENLEALRKILQVPASRIDEVLQIVKLTKDANRAVKDYSLGMKQRLGIAASMLGNPELLILDEPTNGLDPAGIQEIRTLIKEMPVQYGMTVLVSSHLLSEIDQMATQVGIITKGKLIFQDSIDTLRNKATSHLLLTVNELDRAKRLLLSKGIVSEIQGEQLSIDYMANKQLASIVSFLVSEQVDMYRIEEQKTSLEDIFLELTKEEAPNDASSAAS